MKWAEELKEKGIALRFQWWTGWGKKTKAKGKG